MTDKTSVPEEADESKTSGPQDPEEINPELASDIHYWTQELNVTGQQLHEAIRVHGARRQEDTGSPSSEKVIYLGGHKGRTAAIQRTILQRGAER